MDLREKERDRQTNCVTNQSECQAPAYSRALNLSRIIVAIRNRPINVQWRSEIGSDI